MNSEITDYGAAPLLRAALYHPLFLHFRIDPALLARSLRTACPLDLFDHSAWLTVSASILHTFRPPRLLSPAWLLRRRKPQHLLTLHTYCLCRNHPAILLLHAWLPKPLLHLVCPRWFSGANTSFDHEFNSRPIQGEAAAARGRFLYHLDLKSQPQFNPCTSDRLACFTFRREVCCYERSRKVMSFHASHAQVAQAEVPVSLEDDSLIRSAFEWFTHAHFERAHLSPGFEDLQLASARSVPHKPRTNAANHVLSSFYDLP